MTCFPANPLVCDSTDAAGSLHKVPQFHVNSTHESEPSSSFIALVIPRPRSRQYSPRRRLYRTSPTPHGARHSSMCAKPMKLLGLNLAIPFAVRSGGCCSGFRCSGSRFTSLRGKTSGSGAPGFQGCAAHCFGPIPCPQTSRFQPIFQVLFCRGPMLCDHDPARLRCHIFWRRGHAAYPQDRYVGRRAQGPLAKTKG
jgi:hypothetical protein